MANRLLAATRKGLFTLVKEQGSWSVAQRSFVGDNATITLFDPRDQSIYVALTHGHFGTKLHRSDDLGATWTEIGVPVFPEFTDADRARQAEAGEIGARRDFSSLKEIWELTPGGVDRPGVLWAGTIPGGLFRSEDRGETWTLIESLWHRDDRWRWFGGGKDHPGIHSVAIDPRDSRRITVAISCGGVWQSADDGVTWETRAAGMRAEYMPPEMAYDPNAQDPHRLAICLADPDVMWVQHHNGIFRTADGGLNWKEMEGVLPACFGFAVAAHPHDPQTAWFVPAIKDECRVPVDGKLVVTRTRDSGQTFTTLRQGLPQHDCYDLVYRHCLDIDATGEQLAIGSTTGGLWVSENGGDAWECVTTHLPPIHCLRFAE